MITASFGEADILVNYVGPYLCDRQYFIRDWAQQCKASSFLTQWVHSTVPKMINKFEIETGRISVLASPDSANIP